MSVLYAGDGWARRELSFKQLKQTNFIDCLHKVIFKHRLAPLRPPPSLFFFQMRSLGDAIYLPYP